MNIAIVGTGHIGTALGERLSRAGHDIVFGSEHPAATNVTGARVTDVSGAISAGEVVIVTIPFGAWPDFAREHGAALSGKVVLDTTNANVARDGEIARNVKAGGQGTLAFIAALVPEARMVKAFNTMQAEVLAKGGDGGPHRLAYPIAGDDPSAVATAARLVRDAGFDPVIAGRAAAAKAFDEGAAVYNSPMAAAPLADALGVAHLQP